MTGINEKIQASFFREVSAAPLAVYRICFGALMVFSTLRFMSNGWIETQYIEPTFHFSYFGFEWLPYPPESVIYLLFILVLISSILIMLGLFYRIATIIFFIAFTYIELLDKTYYLNHYYFVSLIGFLLIFISANQYCSLDAKFGISKASKHCQSWEITILKFQIAVVYIYAGIAKIHADWLIEAQPLKYWLHTTNHWGSIGDFLKQDWVATVFSWFGCIYDLTIVFFLLWRPSRKIAYLFVVIFHLLTWLLFPIGVFPWVMMAATMIFFSASFHEKLLSLLPSFNIDYKRIKDNRGKLKLAILIPFLLFQIIFPFRSYAYNGDLFWTESGYRFSWRVMLMEKTGEATFYVQDSEKEIAINNSDYLNKNQEKMMATQADMILEFAHFLGETYKDTVVERYGHEMKFQNPSVHAEVYVTLNGRPHQKYVDKKHNLLLIKNNLAERTWLEPFNP